MGGVSTLGQAQVDVVVSAPDGHRELRERLAWSDPLRIDVPTAWLGRGRHTVQLAVVNPPPGFPSIPLYTFTAW